MARLWSSGAELNTSSSSIEVNGFTSGGTATVISSSTLRTGSFSYRSLTTAGSSGVYQNVYLSAATQGVYFYRAYINIATLPPSTVTIFRAGRFNGGFEGNVAIRLTSTGTVQLYNFEDSAQVGSDSSALSTGIWYRIEFKVDTTTLATTAVDARIDGTSFASGTINLADANDRLEWGVGSAVVADVFFDEIAVNDNSGSFQNSYPGAGEIRHLQPSATGDANAWTRGGTDSGANWSQISEVTPDDVTKFNSSNTLNQEDLVNIGNTPTGIGTSDTINVVQVGVRFNGVGASANASFKLEIEASASGTIEQSAAITPASATWVTNAAAAPRNYSLTLYDLPGASTTAWTKTDLDAAQIGYKLTATSTNAAQISTVWMLVDSTPGTTLDIDSASNSGEGTSVSTKSYTHTIASSGGNKIVVVGTQTRNNTANTNLPVTGITYNGVAMTKIRSDQYNSTGWLQTELWYLVNPSNGASTVAVTWTGSNDIVSFGTVVLVSAAQTGQADANAGSNATAQASPVTTSVTTVTDLDWIIDSLFTKIGTAIVGGTGQTELMNLAVNAAGDRASMSRKGPITPAASSSMQWTYTGSDDYAQSVVAIKPFSAGGGGGSIVSLGYRSLLGIGI